MYIKAKKIDPICLFSTHRGTCHKLFISTYLDLIFFTRYTYLILETECETKVSFNKSPGSPCPSPGTTVCNIDLYRDIIVFDPISTWYFLTKSIFQPRNRIREKKSLSSPPCPFLVAKVCNIYICICIYMFKYLSVKICCICNNF